MANEIKLGTLDISAFKVGSADTKVYLGDTLVYPSFQGKWLATYTGGTTSSAECDASSAITQNEITLTDLVTVKIGNCVTSIGDSAFQDCSGLTSATIGNGVTSIGQYAFASCRSLTSVAIGSGVTSIGFAVFSQCRSLPSIVIPSSVTSISNNAFYGCSGLTSCTIGSGVTSIGNRAFEGCSGLTSIVIPSGVTSIGNRAFAACSGLTSITVNATTPPTLGSNTVFDGSSCNIYVPCESVSAYTSASGWSTYASRIVGFSTEPTYDWEVISGEYICVSGDKYQKTKKIESYDCGSTWQDVIPYEYSAGTMIESASTDCTLCQYNFCGVDDNGNDVTVDNGTSTLNKSNISAYNLVEGTVGQLTTTIGAYAFEGSSISALTLSDTVTTIEHEAFQDAYELTSLTIPSGVTTIEFWAFARMTNCQEVIFESETVFPTPNMPVFHDWYPTVVYVPDNAVSAYRAKGINWWIDGVDTYPDINTWIQPISNR